MHPETRFLFTASMDVDPTKESLFNEVYDTEHIPELLKVPGVLAVYRSTPAPRAASARRRRPCWRKPAPTFVRTALTAPVFNNPEILKKVMEHTPLGVLPDVDDIAAAILFLAGPAARCITGITLPVDSGYLAR